MSTERPQRHRTVLRNFPMRRGALLGTGLLIEFVGIVADTYWHYVLGIHEVGTIPFPHWITLTGMFVALVGAIDGWQSVEGYKNWLYTIGVVAGSVQILGSVWDNWLHITGVEPEPWAIPHTVYRLGFIALVVVAIAVKILRALERRVHSDGP